MPSLGKTFTRLGDLVAAGQDSEFHWQDFRRQLHEQQIAPLFELSEEQEGPFRKPQYSAQALALGPQLNLLAKLAISLKSRRQDSDELHPADIEQAVELRRCLKGTPKLLSLKENY